MIEDHLLYVEPPRLNYIIRDIDIDNMFPTTIMPFKIMNPKKPNLTALFLKLCLINQPIKKETVTFMNTNCHIPRPIKALIKGLLSQQPK